MIDKLLRLCVKNINPNPYLVKLLGVNIGHRCRFSKNVCFGSEPYLITIGDDFFCSTSVNFITHDGSISVIRKKLLNGKRYDLISPILIGNNVFLGFDTTILRGSVIGDNTIVGAKSLVMGILEPNSVYAGIPARKICSIEELYEKNKNQMIEISDNYIINKKSILKSMFSERNDDA
ncbi:acyltransferase [Vibrio alginolyticus]|uniref:acyltransferase n=1 Tax=Vibrio alginolyticus TaxID=663 RepID=UPI001BD5876E|nr:acyltransferase [Vibrio alginolyticus]MBS9950503.1 acyltransferase [Vibrio alginolyticus]